MSTQLTIIRIESADHNAATPLLINGVLRKRIRHNVDTRLDPAELEALSNSNTVFKLVDGASSAQSADGGAERGLSAPPGTPAPERRGARLAVDPFDAKATLAQTIARISEDLDEFSADEIRALIAAEKAGQGRVTLVEALERKLAALGDLAASDRQRPAPLTFSTFARETIMSTQQKKPIAKASDGELRDFAELVLQLNAEGCGTRARLLALIRPAWPADYIFVEAADAAAAGDGEEPQADAARPQAQVKLAGGGGSKDDPKWLIRISATELTGGKDPVPVGVNGHIVVIQRNMEVEVPHRYIEALRNAVRVSVAQDPRTQEFTLSAFTNYPLEIIERPSRDEIEAFRDRTKDLVLA